MPSKCFRNQTDTRIVELTMRPVSGMFRLLTVNQLSQLNDKHPAVNNFLTSPHTYGKSSCIKVSWLLAFNSSTTHDLTRTEIVAYRD